MLSRRTPGWILAIGLTMIVLSAAALVAQTKRDISVSGRKYTYVVSDANGPEIRVRLNDVVSITFTAEDIPHSFTIVDSRDSHYRIDKRAEPGKPVTFQFRADTKGTFEIHCTLAIDTRCQREMKGNLIVTDAGGR
jgi:heme/copper-type cytochrome/quinol oxidase subunit 2